MTSTNLQQWIAHPEELNGDTLYELRSMLARYPYFQTARLLYLKNLYLLHDINFGNELRKAALYVTDRRVLFYLIEGDKFVIEPKQTQTFSLLLDEEPGLDRTLSLIESFLATVPEEKKKLSSLDISVDYAAYLLEGDKSVEEELPQELTPKLRGQELIDGFISKSDTDVKIKLHESADSSLDDQKIESLIVTEDEVDEGCFTETLAKIYIKQQRYSKALEIIKKLNLKYPKKNAYFADQIRFLEKLIINTKSK